MGEELIYQLRKMPLYMAATVITAMICFAAIMLAFSSFVGTFLFWIAFSAVWGSAILIIILLAYASTRPRTGNVRGVPISDLSKAIFWLSAVNSRRDPLTTGYTYDWQSVDKVVAMIGSEPRRIWESITMRAQMPKPPKRPKSRIAAAFLAIGSMFGSAVIVDTLTHQRFLALGTGFAIGILLVIIASRMKDGVETARLLIEDTKIVDLSGNLVQELISWTSDNTDHPIRIVVMEKAYGAEPVEPLRDYIIAEIKPKPRITTSIEPTLTHKKEGPTEREIQIGIRKQKVIFASAHIMAALGIGFLVLLVADRVVNGKPDSMDFIAFGTIVLFFVFMQYAVYSLLPFTKMMLRGYKFSPSDLEMMLKRTPRRWLEREYYQNLDFKQKIDLMQTFTKEKSVELPSLHESVKLWLQEDARQPQKFRYFKTAENNVTLTPKGEMLIETVRKKGHNIDKLLRKMEDLQQRMRSHRHV